MQNDLIEYVSPRRALLDFQIDSMPLQRAAFVEGELGQRLVVIGERLDFVAARGREVALQLEHLEAGALAVFEFFLLGLQRGFRVLTGLPGGGVPRGSGRARVFV